MWHAGLCHICRLYYIPITMNDPIQPPSLRVSTGKPARPYLGVKSVQKLHCMG